MAAAVANAEPVPPALLLVSVWALDELLELPDDVLGVLPAAILYRVYVLLAMDEMVDMMIPPFLCSGAHKTSLLGISSNRIEKLRRFSRYDSFVNYTNKHSLFGRIKPINFKQGVCFQKIFILAEYGGNCFTYRGKTCRIGTVRGIVPSNVQAVSRTCHSDAGQPEAGCL